MNHLPLYIPVVFIATTLLTLLFFYKAAHCSKWVLTGIGAWLLVQGIIGASGFYTVTTAVPPRFLLLVLPPLMLVLLLLLWLSKQGRHKLDKLDGKTLTILHVVRIPVELVLLWLYQQKTIPQLMTFEGHNFDIISGLTAPVVYYFGYIKKSLPKWVMLLWNFLCLALLFNIVVHAILSAPFPFQQLAFEQPNIAVLHFPYVWLPGLVVPLVLLAHLVCIRQLLQKNK